jgi:hypothetical protein
LEPFIALKRHAIERKGGKEKKKRRKERRDTTQPRKSMETRRTAVPLCGAGPTRRRRSVSSANNHERGGFLDISDIEQVFI